MHIESSQIISNSDLKILQSCPPIADLSPENREKAISSAKFQGYSDSAIIIEQGTIGDAFFVVIEGIVEVVKEDNGKMIVLSELSAGAYFGEQALIGKKSGTRGATVRSKGKSRVASISATVFQEVIATLGQNRDRCFFAKDDLLVREGDLTDCVYLLLSGLTVANKQI